ncbi:MAG: hypothetical protein ACRDNZ_16160 [Streptosporangiaceae bacterium]
MRARASVTPEPGGDRGDGRTIIGEAERVELNAEGGHVRAGQGSTGGGEVTVETTRIGDH